MPSKAEIVGEIERARPDLQHEIAARYGGILLDLKCKSRHCDGKISRYWTELPKVDEPDLRMEVRFVPCHKCGVKGAWNVIESPAPNPAFVEKAKAEEASAKEQARKDEIKRLDDEILLLKSRRDVLDPPKIIEKEDSFAEPTATA